ncbi:MAG: cupin domain-containing protein [Wenzhouxiangella sp.]|jgi:hypothetical protein|nr:cupin domain-containing protein [Wenzhouxiangella sp.]
MIAGSADNIDRPMPQLIGKFSDLADLGRTGHWRQPELEVNCPEFTESDLDLLLETDGHSVAHYRFMKLGVAIEPKLMKLLDSDGRLMPERVDSLKAQGITIIASRLESKINAIRDVARDIQRTAGCYVRAVGIASFGSVHGMPRHYDHVDVFVLQTLGKKRWRFFGGPIEGAGVARKIDEEPEEESATLEIVKGEQLFVPAGIFHQCDPTDLSFHLAFNLKWPCVLDLLGLKYDAAMASRPELMEPIRWFGRSDRLREISATLHPLLDEFSYSGDLESDLAAWAERCEKRFALRDGE